MAKICVKAVWNYKHRLDKDGKGAIHIYVSFCGEHRLLPTNFAVVEKDFDKKNESVKNLKNATEINARIRAMKNKIMERKDALDIKGDIYTIDELLTERKKQTDFIEFIREQARLKINKRTGLKVGAAQQNAYTVLIADLQQFARKKRIPFSEITLDFIRKFHQYLQDTPRADGKPLHINTIKHRHNILKSFILLAIDAELITKNPYAKFPIKGIPSRRVCLTAEELKRIEILTPLESAALAKDLFLFGCYTGLRFEDIMELTAADITREGDKVMLHTRENKTKKLKTLPLHLLFDGKPIAIIDKYKTGNRDTLFPPTTDQSVNRILKSIAMGAGINKEITFHVSRHTFGTFMANQTKDPFLLKELMNHSDINTTMRYIHESESGIAAKLENVNFDY